ncbi:aminoglycoside phosphotransferase family protein [Bacillus sp. 1P06AnD]|uniref:aminoglycoside phosphotransferase family protein n=1 Tax=Bacillus sp. 1P06AnD TaxID=3132208 RepID=UPI0039A3E7D3
MVFKSIRWIVKNQKIKNIINTKGKLQFQSMNQGFEAEVVKITTDQHEMVLKIWNKESKPDIACQFQLLTALQKASMPVSIPYGWGIDQYGHSVLLTSYDGEHASVYSRQSMEMLAETMVKLHLANNDALLFIDIPSYDLASYFFPGIQEYPDLHVTLEQLIGFSDKTNTCPIHGDLHWGNMVQRNGELTIIDWTNIQMGDRRYDFAWTYLLMRVYPCYSSYIDCFSQAYLGSYPIPAEELAIFEAIACLRWILLSRRKGVPREKDTLSNIKQIITNNVHIPNGLII